MSSIADESADMAESIAGKWVCTPFSITMADFPISVDGFAGLDEIGHLDQIHWIEFIDESFLKVHRKEWLREPETLGAVYSLRPYRPYIALLRDNLYRLQILFVSGEEYTVFLMQNVESHEIILQAVASYLRNSVILYRFTREDNKQWDLSPSPPVERSEK